MFAPVKIWQLRVCTTTAWMQSRQLHSESLVNGQSSIFARELRKYSKTSMLSPDEFPAITRHWDCTKCICLCLETLLAISWTYQKEPFGMFTGPNSFKSTETFALREFEMFQPIQVIYPAHAVKTTCRKDAGLSAARWAMPIFPHLSCMIFPELKVFQKWFTSAVVFMLQMFSFLICVQINLSSLSVYFGWLFPKVSASLLLSLQSKERAI